jgi:hypothetical protein
MLKDKAQQSATILKRDSKEGKQKKSDSAAVGTFHTQTREEKIFLVVWSVVMAVETRQLNVFACVHPYRGIRILQCLTSQL